MRVTLREFFSLREASRSPFPATKNRATGKFIVTIVEKGDNTTIAAVGPFNSKSEATHSVTSLPPDSGRHLFEWNVLELEEDYSKIIDYLSNEKGLDTGGEVN